MKNKQIKWSSNVLYNQDSMVLGILEGPPWRIKFNRIN